ncbi:MAG TPA: hypothetical protein VHB72_01985 [Candidatus Saccharimonadales bacterium]|nr:hypothetical protein [Candidatus Saccharimonadales bacterium]
MNLLPKIFPRSEEDREAELERELLRIESKIGGQLFGPVPKGHRREFFCLDEYTWIWHEEWMENGKRKVVTTRYEVRPNDILKIQDGQVYQHLSENEARNFYRAVGLYSDHVIAEYNRMLQTA